MSHSHGRKRTKTLQQSSDVLKISVFRSVTLANPAVRDQCQLRPGPKPCWESCCTSARWWSAILTEQNKHPTGKFSKFASEVQTSAGHEKKAQYVEISHACRAQKRLEPIIIILLQVLLLKVANTASTLADFSLVGCRFFFFCLRNKTNLPSADS